MPKFLVDIVESRSVSREIDATDADAAADLLEVFLAAGTVEWDLDESYTWISDENGDFVGT